MDLADAARMRMIGSSTCLLAMVMGQRARRQQRPKREAHQPGERSLQGSATYHGERWVSLVGLKGLGHSFLQTMVSP